MDSSVLLSRLPPRPVINLSACGAGRFKKCLPSEILSRCAVHRADRRTEGAACWLTYRHVCTERERPTRRGPLSVAAAVRERELSRHMRQGRRWLRCIGPLVMGLNVYLRLEPLELEESTVPRMVNDVFWINIIFIYRIVSNIRSKEIRNVLFRLI